MKLSGSCHCQALAYQLEWPDSARSIPARRCDCTFCSRFGGTWTSNPDASLNIQYQHGDEPGRYRFGTSTADFLFCSRCGIVVAALDENSGRLKAVVNIRTLKEDAGLPFEHSDSHFDGESTEERLGRRSRNWIGHVQIGAGGPAD